MNRHWSFLGFSGLLGVLSTVVPKVSVFAFLLLVIALSSLFRLESPKKRLASILLFCSLGLSLFGIYRFVDKEALQGISEARGRATSKRAVSLLREILFAEDAVRRLALIDPDGNKVGGAGRLGELSGSVPARGTSPVKTPPLSVRLSPRFPTSSGPAAESDGYLLIVCVPGREKEWVTNENEPVDERKSEERWVAYAWPVAEGLGHQTAYFIDEHERILESANIEDGRLRLVGSARAPACDDALVPKTAHLWRTWNEKAPRATLPGAAPRRDL